MNKFITGCMSSLAFCILASCAVETDDRGECPLNCSKAVPISRAFDSTGSNQIVTAELVTAASDQTVIWCTQSGQAPDTEAATQPTRVQFRFSQVVNSYPFKGKANEETKKLRLTAEPAMINTTVPLAGAAFSPVVSGTVSPAHTDPSVATYDETTKTTEPAQLAGIVTPRDEWCTDACGIATIEVWLKCGIKGGVAIYLNSGAITTEQFAVQWDFTASLNKMHVMEVRHYAYNQLPSQIPGFLQTPSFDANPYNQAGEKPWIDHQDFNVGSIQAASDHQPSTSASASASPSTAFSNKAAKKTWN